MSADVVPFVRPRAPRLVESSCGLNRLLALQEGGVIVSPFDVLFAEGDCVDPDIVFVRSDRLEILAERGAEGPPDTRPLPALRCRRVLGDRS